MSKLREQVDTLLYGLEKCGHDRGYVLDNVITLIRNATLDDVLDACAIKEFDDHSFYLLTKATNNLRGESDE